MAKRTVRVAVLEYRNAAGKRRLAYFGNVVDLSADEVTRCEAIGAVRSGDETPEPVATVSADSSASAKSRPSQTAPKTVWVEFAVTKGIAKSEAEDLTKQELIALLSD